MRQFLIFLLLATCTYAFPPPVSFSPGFKEASELLMDALNFTADPCENFYNYACGGWISKNEIPSDMTSISRFVIVTQKIQKQVKDLLESTADSSPSRARRMVRTLYKKCIDEEAVERARGQEMIKAIRAIGPWPMIESSSSGSLFNPRDFELTALLVEVGIRGVSPFLNIYITIDDKNTSRRVLAVDQGGLYLGKSARNHYLNQTKYAKQIQAYKKYMLEKTSLITEDYGSALNETALMSDIEEIIQMETKLAEILTPDEDRRNYTEQYNIKKLSELSELFPLIDWPRYFKSSAPIEVHEYIDSDPDVLVSEINFLKKLTKLLAETNPRIITNYIMLRYSGSFNLMLDSRYEDAYQRLVKVLYGKESKSERWKTCVSAAMSKMSHASSALYASAHFDKNAKNTTLAMIDEIKDAYDSMLRENDWMDQKTKETALKKADQMIRMIGFADWVLDDEKLDEWYEKLDINSDDSLAVIVEKTHRWSNNFSYRRLLEQVDRAEFNTNSATVNAFYSSIRNGIMFPAGILQPPFFHPDFPRALNYGGIGAVIGHEITHGFDDQGSQFDGTGNLQEWWQPSTREEFQRRTECIINQYGNETIPEIDLNVNGKLTQGENIADNGGIKAAYKAYMSYIRKHGEEARLPGLSKITNEQLFFIGYAQTWCKRYKDAALTSLVLTDTHSPAKFRVDVVAKNQQEFADAFNCPSNSKMNPATRCAVW